MCHCTAGGNTVKLVCKCAGCTLAAADICSSCTVNCGICTLSTARTEFKYGSALSGTDNSVSLCRNESLMIDCEEKECFNKLSFNCRRFDCHNRLVRENRSSLGDCINITAEFEVSQILKKLLVKNALALEIFDILVFKMKFPDVFNSLFKTCHNRKTAVVGNFAEEHIKIDILFIKTVFKIAV